MTEEAFDPDVDIDPNEAIDIDYDEATDTEETPANDQADEDHEDVAGAQPVDEELADEELPSAEDEITEEI